jgi:hypothetical protein
MNRTPAIVRPTTTIKTGLTALAVAGILDLLLLLALGIHGAPVAVVIAASGLGLATLIGVATAWRGSRAGLLTAVVARVVDTLLGIPAFFLHPPAWVQAERATMLALSVVGVVLVASGLRRGTPTEVAP